MLGQGRVTSSVHTPPQRIAIVTAWGRPRGGKTRFAIELIKAAPPCTRSSVEAGWNAACAPDGRGEQEGVLTLQREPAYAARGNGLTRKRAQDRVVGGLQETADGLARARRGRAAVAAVAAATRLRRGRRGDRHRGPRRPRRRRARHPAATEGCLDPHEAEEQGTQRPQPERVRRALRGERALPRQRQPAAPTAARRRVRRAILQLRAAATAARRQPARLRGLRAVAGGAGVRARRVVRCAPASAPAPGRVGRHGRR